MPSSRASSKSTVPCIQLHRTREAHSAATPTSCGAQVPPAPRVRPARSSRRIRMHCEFLPSISSALRPLPRASPPLPAVQRATHSQALRGRHGRVVHGRAHVPVPEKVSDDAEVVAAPEHPAGERVPQRGPTRRPGKPRLPAGAARRTMRRRPSAALRLGRCGGDERTRRQYRGRPPAGQGRRGRRRAGPDELLLQHIRHHGAAGTSGVNHSSVVPVCRSGAPATVMGGFARNRSVSAGTSWRGTVLPYSRCE